MASTTQQQLHRLTAALSDIHVHAHTEHTARRALKERVQLIERQQLRVSALQRAAIASSSSSSSARPPKQVHDAPSSSLSSFVSKPFGYSQELAYQTLVRALRQCPHALACVCVLHADALALSGDQMASLGANGGNLFIRLILPLNVSINGSITALNISFVIPCHFLSPHYLL
jgi:hypothetical protein